MNIAPISHEHTNNIDECDLTPDQAMRKIREEGESTNVSTSSTKDKIIPFRDSVSSVTRATVFSENLAITGSSVETPDDVHIFGRFEKGNLACNKLRIEAGASASGDVVAKEVYIAGTFSGTVKAENVHLVKGSSTNGKIIANNISMENGSSMKASVSTEGVDSEAGETADH